MRGEIEIGGELGAHCACRFQGECWPKFLPNGQSLRSTHDRAQTALGAIARDEIVSGASVISMPVT